MACNLLFEPRKLLEGEYGVEREVGTCDDVDVCWSHGMSVEDFEKFASGSWVY